MAAVEGLLRLQCVLHDLLQTFAGSPYKMSVLSTYLSRAQED